MNKDRVGLGKVFVVIIVLLVSIGICSLLLFISNTKDDSYSDRDTSTKKVKKEVSHSTLVKNAGLRARSSVSIDNGMSQEEKDALIEEAKRKNEGAEKGTMASKVNMVKEYNDYKEVK